MRERNILLLVDDQEVNLSILKQILGDQYDFVTARNGQEALVALQANHGAFAAIILDVIMPVMDGYTFLERKAKHPEYRGLPVLVTTAAQEDESEEKCLSLGAWDFIQKPYRPRTVRLRLANIIARSRQALLEQLVYVSEHDHLTGLFNRSAFFDAMQAALQHNPRTAFSLVRVDINRFGLINSLYGTDEGDRLLLHLSAAVRGASEDIPGSCCGRIEADVFCLCVPCADQDLKRILAGMQKNLSAYASHYYIEPCFGVYRISDRELEPEAMYRRATLASRQCKNNYQNHVSYFSPDMTERDHVEQRIANDMEQALESGQFVVYLQPKFDIAAGRACGAEALVRWQHPEYGLIPPDIFVPVFEKNGFITQLDRFMWEQTCVLLHRWLAAGTEPAPISVNVSRQDLYDPHFVGRLLALIRKYDVPAQLMQLEVTESAYMDNPERMRATVARLRRAGFTLLMDDFGSAYSSLNALQDIPVDILKMDMHFLAPSHNEARGRSILYAMLRMAEALDLPVIVEGVEKKSQRDFLCSIGCRYAQGYYFSEPLPIEQYEALMAGKSRAAKRITAKAACSLAPADKAKA